MKKKKKADKKSEASDKTESSSTSVTSKEYLANVTSSDEQDLTSFDFFIFILSFAAYSSTCYRSFPGGDSTELIGNGSKKCLRCLAYGP